MTKKTQLNRKGFSLIEVMVAVAVMTVVMLGFSQMTTFNMKAQKGVQDTSDLNTFTTAFQQVMGVSNTCQANLAGVTAVGSPSPAIPAIHFDTTQSNWGTLQTDTGFNGIYYPKTDSAGNFMPNLSNPLLVSETSPGVPGSFAGWNVGQMGVRVQGGGGDTWYITLEVNFNKKSNSNGATFSLGGSKGVSKTTSVTVTTTASGSTATVTGCGAGSGGSSSLTANGYQIFPSGLIIQWGSLAEGAVGGPVTLPIPFPHACFGVQLTLTGSQNSNVYTYDSLTTTGFNYGSNPWGSTGFSGKQWFAVGH